VSNGAQEERRLGLLAVRALLIHDHNLLGIRELGRLSVSSHEIQAIFNETMIWKKVFEAAVAAGE
jgi:hypothetical protein